ncbi:MAG: cell division protein FtsZ [Bacteroidetes bacterium]|nr:cell division protein FtsZ [Bacteroidota bacterium]
MAKLNPEIETFARIKVIGVGGSGKNAINHMINSKVNGVEFIVMNTDVQDLHKSLADKKINLGKNLTKGLGAGMNPEVGKKAAEETKAEIQDVIKGADLVFIAGGMGGGTGTGAAPIVARASKEQGILTVAVVTRPFSFEGAHRSRLAEGGIKELEKEVDAIVIIPNDRLLAIADKDTTFEDAFAMSDEILKQAVEGVTDIISTPGKVNLDYNDIKAVLADAGSALMGIGRASGENRAEEAALRAINSPLLEISINGAKGVLFSVASSGNLGIQEVNTIANIITESVDPDAKIIFGRTVDERLKKDEIRITVIATGFPIDTPRKSLFASQAEIEIKKTIEMPVERKSEEHRPKKPEPVEIEDDFIPVQKDSIEIIDDAFSDDSKDDDDWSAVPSFLRRKK